MSPNSPATQLTVESVARIISEAVAVQTRLAPWEARPAARAVLELLSPSTGAVAQDGDEHHTLDELYDYRMLYNALAANEWAAHGTYPVVKSWRHSDGEECFGGGWFIVVATLPTGQVSNHYRAEHWDLFAVPSVELPPEYDGHVPAEAALRMRTLLSQPTPSAEPPTIVTGMRVRYIDGGAERIVGEFTDGAWDLGIPGTEKSRMCVEPEVFWQTVEPIPTPPSIADMAPTPDAQLVENMAPNTTFTARIKHESEDRWARLGGAGVYVMNARRQVRGGWLIDPSTIRDVIPPAEAQR